MGLLEYIIPAVILKRIYKKDSVQQGTLAKPNSDEAADQAAHNEDDKG